MSDDAEFGSFVTGKQEQETFMFHRNLVATDQRDECIMLAGAVKVDHASRVTTVQYATKYLEQEGAVAIALSRFPLQKEAFNISFSKDDPFDGIPSAFFNNAANGFWRKIARNAFVDQPEDAPRTPAQFLLMSVSGTGLWYFTPTRQLVRPTKQIYQFDDDFSDLNDATIIEKTL